MSRFTCFFVLLAVCVTSCEGFSSPGSGYGTRGATRRAGASLELPAAGKLPEKQVRLSELLVAASEVGGGSGDGAGSGAGAGAGARATVGIEKSKDFRGLVSRKGAMVKELETIQAEYAEKVLAMRRDKRFGRFIAVKNNFNFEIEVLGYDFIQGVKILPGQSMRGIQIKASTLGNNLNITGLGFVGVMGVSLPSGVKAVSFEPDGTVRELVAGVARK